MRTAIHLLNSLKHGGGETVSFNYAKILKALGIKSIFVGRTASVEFTAMLSNHGDVQVTLDKCAVLKADFIFVHTNQSLLRLFKYRSILRKQGIRVFYIQHLYYSSCKFLVLSKLINYLCTDFIQISPITTALIKGSIKINTIYLNNFYLNRYSEGEWQGIRDEKRRILRIDPESTVIMFSAVFKEGKGLGDMLSLISKIMEMNIDKYVFLIVGDGPERELIQNFRHKDKLIWTGFVNDVEEFLVASDVYFFPSLFHLEMMPMALIEAINMDKRILAYRTEINNFLLNDCTCSDLQEVFYNLNNEIFPVELTRYDYHYALGKFQSTLEL